MTQAMAAAALAGAATSIAWKGARRFLQHAGVYTAELATSDRLTDALKKHVKAKLDGAQADAQEALACGMAQAAEHTFAASMALAGIAAAKEVTGL